MTQFSVRSLKAVSLKSLKVDLLVVHSLSSLGREVERSLGISGISLKELLKKESFTGKVGEARWIDGMSKGGPRAFLVVGLTDTGLSDSEILRKTAAQVTRQAMKRGVKKIACEDFLLSGKLKAEERAQALSEGVLLGSYQFHRYKSKDENSKTPPQEFEVLTSDPSHLSFFTQGLKKGVLFGEATNFSRDLVNVPATDMTPRQLAEEAKKIGLLPHLSVKIFEKKEIEKMGMNAYLAVARGSQEPPYLIHLVYRPTGVKARRKIAIVGKGITFDSGGLSLKPANSMETMKDDMSGAASMLAIMKTLAVLKPPVEVHGISATTENMPSGSADKPGDIVRAVNGKTIEILNTDAEGRLTLADAIPYALKQKPDVVIDMATLTGACVVALGELCSGIMGNNQKLIDTLILCSERAGEKIWQLPLIEEYKKDIKSRIADLKNTGGKGGGTITAGLFLQEFTDPKIPWAHIDIAGPSWTEKELDDCPPGGTGHITRTLLHFILSQ